jgi:starch synthase
MIPHLEGHPLEIVFLSPEAVPFAKTGGLGDVCGALPATLAAQGHSVTLILPAYRSIRDAGISITPTDTTFTIPIRERHVAARILRTTLPAATHRAGFELHAEGTKEKQRARPVSVLFIDQPEYFDRRGLYGDESGEFGDNCERFAFFCRAALHAIGHLGVPIDIVHCNDWQTGLVPAYMRMGFESHPWMRLARSVLTIHNLAYQGRFWHFDFPLLGVDWNHFTPDWFEFYGDINFLKVGIQHADAISTVSPTYAEEIQTELHGCGLDPLLRGRKGVLSGIVNGIDNRAWDPSTDRYLCPKPTEPPSIVASEGGRLHPQGSYDVTSWRSGKAFQKRRLQWEMGLDDSAAVPAIGLVGRLAYQKGWDLILPVLRWHLEQSRPTQWYILGSGDAAYQEALRQLQAEFPGKFALTIGFSDELAHRIEAAADIFVMPSRYEPCGLNQLYSLRYGTVPVVMSTGGLVDTVVDANEQTIADGTATGFRMHGYSAEELDRTIGRALETRFHREKIWGQIVETGMRQDWSWGRIGLQYDHLYARTLSLAKPHSSGDHLGG